MNQHIKFLAFGVFTMLASTLAARWQGYTWAVLLVVGILIIVAWLYMIYIEGWVYYLNTQEDTRYVRLARALENKPQLLRTMELSMRSSLRVWPQMSKGPLKFLADTDVPLSFVAEFLNKSDNTYPCPVGKFSDGQVWIEGETNFGDCRYLANQVLDYFEQLDWVRRPQGGPAGARWSRPEIHPGLIKIALEIPGIKVENS